MRTICLHETYVDAHTCEREHVIRQWAFCQPWRSPGALTQNLLRTDVCVRICEEGHVKIRWHLQRHIESFVHMTCMLLSAITIVYLEWKGEGEGEWKRVRAVQLTIYSSYKMVRPKIVSPQRHMYMRTICLHETYVNAQTCEEEHVIRQWAFCQPWKSPGGLTKKLLLTI